MEGNRQRPEGKNSQESSLNREFVCAFCKITFVSAWTEEEAEQELKETFNIPKEECEILCDDCYKVVNKVPDWFVAEEWPEINGGGVIDIHQIRELEKRWNEFKRTTEDNG